MELLVAPIRARPSRLVAMSEPADDVTENDLRETGFHSNTLWKKYRPGHPCRGIVCKPQTGACLVRLQRSSVDPSLPLRSLADDALRRIELFVTAIDTSSYPALASAEKPQIVLPQSDQVSPSVRILFSAGGYDLRGHPTLGQRIDRLSDSARLCHAIVLERRPIPQFSERSAGTVVSIAYPSREDRRYTVRSLIIA